MKQIANDNLNTFLGMSFNEKNQLCILWKYCSRGSLQDIVHNEDMHLDATFHGAFVRDILKVSTCQVRICWKRSLNSPSSQATIRLVSKSFDSYRWLSQVVYAWMGSFRVLLSRWPEKTCSHPQLMRRLACVQMNDAPNLLLESIWAS